MQKARATAFSTLKYSTMMMAGLTFGALGAVVMFSYGTNIGDLGTAHIIGMVGGNAIGLGVAAFVALPFRKS